MDPCDESHPGRRASTMRRWRLGSYRRESPRTSRLRRFGRRTEGTRHRALLGEGPRRARPPQRPRPSASRLYRPRSGADSVTPGGLLTGMSGPSQHVFEPVRHGEPRLVRLLKSVDARRSDFKAPLRLATALRRRRADFPAQVSLLLQAIEAGVKSSARDRTASPHLELAGERCAVRGDV